MPMTIEEAKRKAQEMKAKAEAKKAARAAAAAEAPPAVDPKDELFLLGDHSLVLIDWDDTLFPTSAWKDRMQENAAHPLRASPNRVNVFAAAPPAQSAKRTATAQGEQMAGRWQPPAKRVRSGGEAAARGDRGRSME